VADGESRTLAVAVAGIAATALVGIAGTTAAWLSAREDREAQRELARDERTNERRVAVYLDAIDFVEGQKEALNNYMNGFRERRALQCIDARVKQRNFQQCMRRREPPTPEPRERTLPSEWGLQFGDVPYQHLPPPRLTPRLRAFGSHEVLDAFEDAQALTLKMGIFFTAVSPSEVSGVAIDNPLNLHALPRGARGFIDRETWVSEKYVDGLNAFEGQITRLERAVHEELGPG
jgi:hypothetical protein